eukprot:237796_1
MGNNIISDQNQCNWVECKCVQNIKYAMKQYDLYIEQQQTDQKPDRIDTLFTTDNASQILNDFNHLLSKHSNDFENIYNDMCQEACEVSKCLLFRRNSRDRSYLDVTLYFYEQTRNDIHYNIVLQQMLDRIHSYLFHTFDIRYKRTQKELDNISKMDHVNVEANNKKLQLMQSKFTMNEYSFGYRYFYWSHYKNNLNIHDDAHWAAHLNCIPHPVANHNSHLCDWYIPNKHISFKAELTQNKICGIGQQQWMALILKASIQCEGEFAKSKKCHRKESAVYYELNENQRISIHHLMAMMIYCNYDKLQYQFSATFRLKKGETEIELKQRHSNYYWLGRLLRECVECFGVEDEPPKKLYHGVSKHVTFPSIF